MKVNLQRKILVTGATGKFGQTLSRYLLGQGHYVIGTARSQEALDQFKETLKCEGLDSRSWTGIPAEFTNADVVQHIVKRLSEHQIQIDCLINNARCLDYLSIEKNGIVARENFIQEYAIDVVVPYELSMALACQSETTLRQIINIGSQYGTVANNLALYDTPAVQSPIHYSVAKAALVHLTKELGIRLAPQAIQVNCIAYGGVEGRVDENFKARFAQLSPIGRMLRSEEIIAPLAMLIDNPSLSMTGHTLHADGGWSLW